MKILFLFYFGETMVRESDFQSEVISDLEKLLPGCIILKNDPNYLQGILDWSIFFEDKWAMLEIKASRDKPHQPNQDYYVDLLNRMSYASFVYPENKEKVFNEIQRAFGIKRRARISRRI